MASIRKSNNKLASNSVNHNKILKIPNAHKTNCRKNRNIILLFLVVIIIILGIYIFYRVFDFFSVIEKKEYYANFGVSNYVGININNTALIFGTVLPGSSSFKKVILRNDYLEDVKVQIYSIGDIKPFITASENNFILKKNESKTIEFKVYTSKNTILGNYSGKAVIIIKRAWF